MELGKPTTSERALFDISKGGVTPEDVCRIAARQVSVHVPPSALERVENSFRFLQSLIQHGETIYGVNTGIGEFSEVKLDLAQSFELQRSLLRSHAAGVGPPMRIEYVRAAIASRLLSICRGHSACRREIVETLRDILNLDVDPIVCSKGSVGACGDLAPMAQIGLLLIGEGEAIVRGTRMSGADAFKCAGIPVPGVEGRDGLAAINGSNVIAGISCLHLQAIERLIQHAELACAMSFEALLGNAEALDERLHRIRGNTGGMCSAEAILRYLGGGDLAERRGHLRLQDAYSLRSSPQIIGAARDALDYARHQVQLELNGVGDNPVFFPTDEAVLSGANFQGTPVAFPMEHAGVGLTMVCVLSERRLNRILNPALSGGLPPFLSPEPGRCNGLMLSQYTAGTLLVEQKTHSTPTSIQSIPAAADQEDFVSMGMNAMYSNERIIENAEAIIGIEMMASAQALEHRTQPRGRAVEAARLAIRQYVPLMVQDRPTHVDHVVMAGLVRTGEVLDAANRVLED